MASATPRHSTDSRRNFLEKSTLIVKFISSCGRTARTARTATKLWDRSVFMAISAILCCQRLWTLLLYAANFYGRPRFIGCNNRSTIMAVEWQSMAMRRFDLRKWRAQAIIGSRWFRIVKKTQCSQASILFRWVSSRLWVGSTSVLVRSYWTRLQTNNPAQERKVLVLSNN